MDASNSDNDISLSPSHLLGRLQVLRQLQIMQRGKLQKQRLQYQSNSETSSSIAEMISHFTNSYTTTSYNSFQSLLQSPQTESPDESPRLELSISQKVQEKDLIDGVSILNLSKESEFIMNSPISSRSGKTNSVKITPNNSADNSRAGMQKKQISLDDMPILSPKTDFETLVIEKLKDTNTEKSSSSKSPSAKNKKPFLRRGEGMSRFGLKKKDLVVQNTNSLPWRKKSNNTSKPIPTPVKKANKDNLDVEILVTEPKLKLHRNTETTVEKTNKNNLRHSLEETTTTNNSDPKTDKSQETSKEFSFKVPENLIQYPNGKHPVQILKGKTWASVLSKEQTDFLSQLKQSEYYKNFTSPTKSVISETSCDESLSKLAQEREMAEQNLFELLENKATNESFLESSFINRFLKSKMNCSGESTPLVMQKCLEKNPNLLHIVPEYSRKHQSYEEETCQSECSECCSDEASTVSSCCSCRCTEPPTPQDCIKNKTSNRPERRSQAQTKNNVVIDDTKTSHVKNGKCQTEKQQEEEAMKVNMVEMNEKLISTSELLKERLQELEDEIETFRKENMSLNKMKEEVDIERQKFYEEKQSFEQKFNEEKILTEYHLAEEKEKLNKQKLIYERYVREMRGRLNKKEKDEVVNLKQEIRTLKEDIRLKDAKSTSIIARLRNQLKIMEKEKTELQNEVEKLKKENRRIQHSNDITRRMSNLKYLQEINKKLNIMGKDNLPEVEVRNDVKYKGFEIERQSRSRKQQIALQTKTIRPRAKSVPNINVTSKYAKYFSQRDTASHFERNTINIEHYSPRCDSEDENIENDRLSVNSDSNESVIDKNISDENNLEKIYMETFRSASPVSNRSANSYKNKEHRLSNEEYSNNGFFLRKSNSSSSRDSKSPGNNSKSSNFVSENDSNRSKSPISILSNRSKQKSPFEPIVEFHSFKSKSPTSIHSNHSSRLTTVIQKDLRDKLLSVSPEPSTSKTSSKTNLNPLEIKKPDGSKELRFPNGNVKHISADGKYSKFVYYNGDVKENFLNEGRIKYFYAETKTYHTTHADGHEVLEFPDGQVEKRYKDGSTEIRLPNGSVRYHDPKNKHVREEWRFPDGASLTVSANGEQRIVFANGQIEVHAQDHKRREFPDGTVKLVYNDGTSETRYASGRVRIKDKHGNLIMDSAPG